MSRVDVPLPQVRPFLATKRKDNWWVSPLLVFLGLTYFVAPAAFMGLHVFVAFLQAYVFTVLTMMYVGGATAESH